MIDTHAHVQFKAFDEDRDAVLARCREKGVVMNVVGTQLSTSQAAVALSETIDDAYASVGLHPIQEYKVPVKEEMDHFTTRGEQFDMEAYSALAAHPKVVAIGETGLDRYHVPKDTAYDVIFETQKKVFLQHVELGKKHALPLVIHVRDAHDEMLSILDALPETPAGVIHCFSGGPAEAERYLAHGLFLGFTGVVTFPEKKTDPEPQRALCEVIRTMPEDRILVETDSPYLAPQAYRGQRAEPWMVEECIKKIAQIRGTTVDDIAAITAANARRLFYKMSV